MAAGFAILLVRAIAAEKRMRRPAVFVSDITERARLLERLDALAPVDPDDGEHRVHSQVAAEGTVFSPCLTLADVALYRAKEGGRDRVCASDGPPD
jgi:hypothetical protein